MKLYSKYLFLLPILFITRLSYGQLILQNQAISTTSKTYINSKMSMDYTLGEIFTNTLVETNIIGTQGFNQPNLKFVTTTGIYEITNSTFKVYPNPFIDQFTIELPENEDFFISIYDVTGKLVHSQQIIDIQNIINLNFLAPGNYRIAYSSTNQIQIGNLSIIKTNL